MPVSSFTEHWIKPDALTINLNHFSDPDYLQVSVLAGAVVMAFKQDVIGYNASHNYRTWPLEAANTYLETSSAYNVYARLTRSEVNARALIVYDTVLRDIEGREITYAEDGSEVLGDASADYFFVYLGQISGSVDSNGQSVQREWLIDFRFGSLDTSQYRNEESGGEWQKMFRLNKVTDMIEVLKVFTSSIFKTLSIKKGKIEKPITDIRRSVDSSDPDDELYVPVDDTTVPTTAWVESRTDNRFLKKYEPDETQHRIKFFDGVECGEFVTGMIGGSGTRFDGDGYGEMNGLTLREFLEVPELRFNRIDVVSGELWNSVAFGLVESVDTENRICTLKLEGKERAGLKVNDICRGIFADFGDGEQWEGVDECGFLHLYGFWTSYFTPTEILDNDEGVFRFKYALKPGTSQHPTQSMKFAVYGNFDDTMPERQASAYSTRTYKRYLNKVNTWVIDPDRNIYAQYGDLEGLTIGGFTMTGYGSFQSNSYFTGVQIQFTPEQKEELKGEDSYSAVLSDYVGIVRMSSDGTVSSGEYVPFNVVTEGQNVITHDYLLRTQIQAFKGSTELAYSEVMEEGCFIASINPTGCVATIENGVICVTEITSMEYSYIKIAVNCEGNASFELTYQIKLVKDGESAIYADIDNEMDAVACDKNGKVLFGLPVSCKAYMFAGTKALELDDITVSAPDGVDASAAVSADGITGVVEVTGITEEAARVLPVNIYLFATHNSQQHVRMLTFTVSKQMQGENGVIYKLVPTSTVLKADRDHSSEYMTVSCFVTKHDGLDVSRIDALPDGYGMTYQVGSGNEEDYPYGDPVAVLPEEKKVVFRLYFGEELIDVETVPVLLDGNTAFKSTVFLRSNEEPGTPTGGSYSDPKPDSEPVWFDGIPLGEETLWASTRIFSIDGLYPQEDSWSQPAPMTDTASFDVEFSDVQINPGNPTDNPENWSNDGGTDTWWMATRVIRNGVPGKWSISQIKGEKGEDGTDGTDGKDGNTAFKSTVFLRSNEEPDTPTGGYYWDPIPDSSPAWTDGIPDGEEMLWASMRIFSMNGLFPQENAWSQPAQMTDTASFDVEFSDVQVNPGNPTDNPLNWSNESGTDTWWMATRVIRNGVPGEWSISKIKGENGEDGIDGEDGADGKDGADAEDYIIEASVSSLGFTMTGGYSPSSFIVSEYHRKGATKTASNKYYMFIYGYKGGTSTYLTKSSSVQNYTFNTDPYDDERYDSFLFELRVSNSETSELVSSTTVSVSKEGQNGKAGAMPRYCGLWRDGVTYEYNDEYRDIVVYNGQVYQVLAHGTSTSSLPTSTVYWEQASKFSFVAMDTALIDSANIAGFTFRHAASSSPDNPVGIMESQNGKLKLDSEKGEITALAGNIGGFRIGEYSLVNEGLGSDSYYMENVVSLTPYDGRSIGHSSLEIGAMTGGSSTSAITGFAAGVKTDIASTKDENGSLNSYFATAGGVFEGTATSGNRGAIGVWGRATISSGSPYVTAGVIGTEISAASSNCKAQAGVVGFSYYNYGVYAKGGKSDIYLANASIGNFGLGTCAASSPTSSSGVSSGNNVFLVSSNTTLPSLSSVGAGRTIMIINDSGSDITVTPSGSDKIRTTMSSKESHSDLKAVVYRRSAMLFVSLYPTFSYWYGFKGYDQ